MPVFEIDQINCHQSGCATSANRSASAFLRRPGRPRRCHPPVYRPVALELTLATQDQPCALLCAASSAWCRMKCGIRRTTPATSLDPPVAPRPPFVYWDGEPGLRVDHHAEVFGLRL